MSQHPGKRVSYMYREHYDDLCTYLLRTKYVPDRFSAEDIVSEVFTRTAIHPPKVIRGNGWRYLLVAVQHLACDVRDQENTANRYRNESTAVLFPVDKGVELTRWRERCAEEIDAAIEGLPKQAKDVFERGRLGGQTHRNVASEKDITIKAVEKNMTRAYRALRLTLAPFWHEMKQNRWS